MSRPPICSECGRRARQTTGAEIYPHRKDLHAKPIWACACGAYVGCHPGTTAPLGTPAGPKTREARSYVHRRLDPIWQNAWTLPCYAGERAPHVKDRKHPPEKAARLKQAYITRTARVRVYEYLGAKLGLTREQCHVGMFDVATCRRAYAVLAGVDYETIRAWAHQQRGIGGGDVRAA